MKNSKPTILDLNELDLNAFNKLAISWQLDFLQFAPGKFRSNLTQVIFDDYQLGNVTFNCGVKQEGTSPDGMWTFALLKDTKIHWRNFKVNPYSIIVYAPGSEINALNFGPLEVATFSVSEESLRDLAVDNHKVSNYESLKDLELLEIDESSFSSLFVAIKHEISLHKTNNIISPNFKESISVRLLELIDVSRIATERVSGVKRLEVLKLSEEYILNHLLEPFTVSDLAKDVGVSERTLLYAFKTRFGIGPRYFINILKLNRVYHELCDNSGDDTSIANFARESGFWHMGQFHKDYKNFFGELPSDTLQRVR